MKLEEKIQSGGVYVIAELSANHAGSMDNALKLVEVAKDCGADCVKIQTYTPDTLTIPCENEYFTLGSGLWEGKNLHQLYGEAFTPWEWQATIQKKCEEVGVDFLSTPFDVTAVDFLENLNMEFYKIASFELVDIPLIRYVAQKQKPMIISCGMGTVEEIQEAVECCHEEGNHQVYLLKCCSQYPAKLENMNLATIVDMKEKFGCTIGFSDHSFGHQAAVIAVSLGAKIVEKHICLSRDIPNPDSAFSMEPAEFKQMVEEINQTVTIMGQVSYKPTQDEQESKRFRKSIFCVKDIQEGDVFTTENIRVIRPSNGAHPRHYPTLLGQVAKKNMKLGEPIILEDV